MRVSASLAASAALVAAAICAVLVHLDFMDESMERETVKLGNLHPLRTIRAWCKTRRYQRNSNGPSSAPTAVGINMPVTYQTLKNGAAISVQKSA